MRRARVLDWLICGSLIQAVCQSSRASRKRFLPAFSPFDYARAIRNGQQSKGAIMRSIIRLFAAAMFAATLPAAALTNMDWNAAGSTGIVDEGTIAAGNFAFT